MVETSQSYQAVCVTNRKVPLQRPLTGGGIHLLYVIDAGGKRAITSPDWSVSHEGQLDFRLTGQEMEQRFRLLPQQIPTGAQVKQPSKLAG